MKKPNEHGVFEPDTTEELARHGRAYAAICLCQCEDGLYRYALDMHYSYGGFGGPICVPAPGFSAGKAAKDAGIEDLLRRWPKAWPGEPQSVHDELRILREQIERAFSQPTLF